MADNPPPQPPQQPALLTDIQHIGNLLQIINGFIDQPIVEIRRHQMIDGNIGEPFIDLSRPGQQYLAIGGNNFPVYVVDRNQTRYIDLGNNNYRIRGQPVVYDANGPERIMAETRFAHNMYYAMFSYGIIGSSGPQAEMLVDDNGQYLYVIDPQTAIQMRNQSLSWANHHSLVYQLMWSSTLISILSLCLYQWSAGNVNDDHIINFRLIIYRLGNRCIDFMLRAIRSKNTYQKAIVWGEAMNRLPLVNPAAPLRQIIPPDVQPIPDIVVQNLQQSVDRIMEFVNHVNKHQMFIYNWQQMFNDFANLNTSVPIIATVEQQKGDQVFEQSVRLTNNQEFIVRVFANDLVENNEWTYFVHSPVFTDTYDGRYDVWPVVPIEPLVVMRKLHRGALTLPLHSHGLAGSYHVNDIQGGNNGFQVTSLNFTGVDGLNHRRLYFVNRAMAMELRELFEIVPNHPITVLSQYHQWFFQLIHMSRIVCDLRQWYRQMVQQDIGGQWLQHIHHCAQQLFLLPNQLFLNYTIISRLEQLWNHSILVPNILNGEPPIRPIQTTSAMYLGKTAGIKRKTKKEIEEQKSKDMKLSTGSMATQKKQKNKIIGQKKDY